MIAVGGLALEVLHPGALTGNTNVDSMVLLLDCGSVEVLLLGDAEGASEAEMLAANVVPDVDVAKAGHHGSRTSSSPDFLAVLQPEVAVISAGLTNRYGHPHAEVIQRFTERGTALYRTDTSGGDDTLVMTSDCQHYEISSRTSAGS